MPIKVPAWDARGVLPPCDPNDPVSADRSPFRVSLYDAVLDFAISAERVQILLGFLQYRQALHGAGLVEGFQWLDGSFFENIELIENRPPKDIDVVTFHVMPTGHDQGTLKAAFPALFPVNLLEHEALKNAFHVDAYTKDLDPDLASLPDLVASSVYWYSMWSHRRDMTWKGYLEVDLDPGEDAATMVALLALPAQPTTPVPPLPTPVATAPQPVSNLAGAMP